MTDSDGLRIRSLDKKIDYSLWPLRVRALIRWWKLKATLLSPADWIAYISPDTATADLFGMGDSTNSAVTATQAQMEEASNIIILMLGDHVVRVARSIAGNLRKMMAKLDGCYGFNSTTDRISTISELVSVKFSNV